MKYNDKDNLQQLDFVSITLYIYIYKKKKKFSKRSVKKLSFNSSYNKLSSYFIRIHKKLIVIIL